MSKSCGLSYSKSYRNWLQLAENSSLWVRLMHFFILLILVETQEMLFS